MNAPTRAHRCYGYPLLGGAPSVRASAGDAQTVPHHWDAGPTSALPLDRPYTRAGVRYTHRMRWYLDRVEGTSRKAALAAIGQVLHDPRAWGRAGVAFVRTTKREEAQILLRVIPQDTTVCGRGAAGCWSSSGAAGEPPVAEIGAEYVGNPVAFATILGMELCGHGCFHLLDMYNPAHQPYLGAMGTWGQAQAVGGFPTDAEITAARTWLDGKTDPRYIHDD